ncbi:F-box domain-containing protein [Heracleum sosnowskyi]|uniref:F-box domain-containing protein n=1 Tax=Heracleum sosnowskyi TaxID=360622 RepID=A0AAD8IUT8_9APIA|nr:F-box domain-containing protein [Heracleum sosnowskyi]
MIPSKLLKSTLILFPLWAERSRNWPELPEELTALILVRLGTVDMISARKVCKTWHRICSDPAMWRVVALAPCGYAYHINLTSVARKAVDLSCGQLIDISISNFGSDYLLQYISDRHGIDSFDL